MSFEIEIYTDGSYDMHKNRGAWAAIILIEDDIKQISKIETNSTHNRMELTAVIEAINYLHSNNIAYTHINIYSDSQYVVNLPARGIKLKQKEFLTLKGTYITNMDLVKNLLNLLEQRLIKLIKVKAHLKQGDKVNYNREIDKVVRRLVRDII